MSMFICAHVSHSFIDSVFKFVDPDYSPSDQDILRCRVKTTGITEMDFSCDTFHFRWDELFAQQSLHIKCIYLLKCCTQPCGCGWTAFRAPQVDPVFWWHPLHPLLCLTECLWSGPGGRLLHCKQDTTLFSRKILPRHLQTCFKQHSQSHRWWKKCCSH